MSTDRDPRNEYVPQPASPYKRERVIAEISLAGGKLQVYVNRREVDEITAGRMLIKAGAHLTLKHLPDVNVFDQSRPAHNPTPTTRED